MRWHAASEFEEQRVTRCRELIREYNLPFGYVHKGAGAASLERAVQTELIVRMIQIEQRRAAQERCEPPRAVRIVAFPEDKAR